MHFRHLASILPFLGAASAQKAFDGGEDLFSFVTEPLLKPPRWNISTLDSSKSKPGYWFTAPYEKLEGHTPGKRLEVCSIGPQIYDNRGELVWSGSCRYKNRNFYDLKVVDYKGKPHLSMIMGLRSGNYHDQDGLGMILDEGYDLVKDVAPHEGIKDFNMHGWNVIDGGKRALLIAGTMPKVVDVSDAFIEDKPSSPRMSMVFDNGFQEIDLETDEVLYDWRSLDHTNLSEVRWGQPSMMANPNKPWDWFHQNQVVKTANGDYLISARHTNTIYRINQTDGEVIWRLEGMGSGASDFELANFNFSRQHDAQIVSEEGDKMVITFLDNAADGGPSHSRDEAAGYYIELDQKTMKATKLKEFVRPWPGGVCDMRGNMQVMSNDNVFLCWSRKGQISEFDQEGNVILNAQWFTSRFVTYRAFKFDNWVGKPTEPMKAKAYMFGPKLGQPMTFVAYVSWNGATEVEKYRWYGVDEITGDSIIGTATKYSFETKFMATGAQRMVYVEALDKNGNVLGTSDVIEAEWPEYWMNAEVGDQKEIQAPTATPSHPITNSDKIASQLDRLTKEHKAAYGTGAAIGFFLLGVVSTLACGRCCRGQRRNPSRAPADKYAYKPLPDPERFESD